VLLFANKTEDDIVMRKELEAKKDRIKLHYILDVPPEGWTHFKGYITEDILKQICPLDDPDTIYVHCGPYPMNTLIRNLFAERYPQSILFKF
jgi:cytochrome-b5 reductase